MEMGSWNFNWYVSPDNLAKVHSMFFNLDIRFLLQFSCIPLLDYTPGIKTYSWEISFLNLAQRTSSKFCPKIVLLLWSQRETCQVRSSIVLSTAGKKPVYKHFCGFMLGQLKKTDWLSGLGYRKTLAIYQVGGFFLLSGGMNISRGKFISGMSGRTCCWDWLTLQGLHFVLKHYTWNSRSIFITLCFDCDMPM